jgi:hypothetical protein
MSKLIRTTQAFIFLLIALFMGTSIVAADYIGPDRTYTVQEATSCGYRYTGSGYSSCGANGYLSDPCTCNITCDTCLTGTGSCISIPTGTVNSTCGTGFSEADRWVNYTNVTVSHPLAVASTVWSCPVPGSNSWCHSPFQVQLNGVDNYSSAGYYITALEGTLDGVPFFADGLDSITIEIGEGTHHLDFWALSSYGDSSYHFIENYYVDTVNPLINASLSGTPGDNNWFVSNTTLTVTFSDPAPGPVWISRGHCPIALNSAWQVR